MKQETKPLDKMSNKELTEHWTKRVEKFLLGQKGGNHETRWLYSFDMFFDSGCF